MTDDQPTVDSVEISPEEDEELREEAMASGLSLDELFQRILSKYLIRHTGSDENGHH